MRTPPTLPSPDIVRVDDVEVATWVIGPRDRGSRTESLVFCHGTPWSTRVWWPVAQQLAEHHTVYLWDLPGYGASIGDATAPVDLATQHRRFADLLRHWQLERPRVVAHDIGGAVALGAHLLHGSEFADLTLCDIVMLEPWGSPFFRLVAENESVFAALPPPLHRALVREYIAGAAKDQDLHLRMRRCRAGSGSAQRSARPKRR